MYTPTFNKFTFDKMDYRYKHFYKKMWETRGARFNAHLRLEKEDQRANIAITWLSAVLVAVSFIQLSDIAFFSPLKNENANLFLAALSFAVLIVSLLSQSRNRQDLANTYLKNGNSISVIYDQFSFCIHQTQPNDDEIQKLILRYSEIAGEDGINHEPIDSEYFRACNASDYGLLGFLNAPKRLYIFGKFFLRSGGGYYIAPLCLFLVFYII